MTVVTLYQQLGGALMPLRPQVVTVSTVEEAV
jgi:hypothetical protein